MMYRHVHSLYVKGIKTVGQEYQTYPPLLHSDYIMCTGLIFIPVFLVLLHRNIVAVVGTLWLVWLLLKAVKAVAGDLCAYFLAPWGISRINLKKYGKWAGV